MNGFKQRNDKLILFFDPGEKKKLWFGGQGLVINWMEGEDSSLTLGLCPRAAGWVGCEAEKERSDQKVILSWTRLARHA